MLDKLEMIREKYEELSHRISDPAVIADQNLWKKLIKEHAGLEPLVDKLAELKSVTKQIEDSRAMLNESHDSDFEEMIKMELSELEDRLTAIDEEIRVLLIPKDPNDEKNVIVEIRGAAGGDEAALFAASLFRMYTRYAERQGWKTEMMSSSPTDIGGYKEVIFEITGKGAYSRLKYESGAHRVQRVPDTEAAGRIHTSTATVAVLPEAEDVDVQINQNDIRIDVFRSSGHGGQSVNTTDSAVRITHIPSGLVVSCQDEKSQLKNKDKAMKVLKSRLLEQEIARYNAGVASDRKSQVGTGDRSERIRTYNFPQGRVTDHRIGLTLYQLATFMDGDIDQIIDALISGAQADKLGSGEVDED